MSTNRCIKFLFIFMILISGKSFSSDRAPLLKQVLDFKVGENQFKMICNPVDLFDDQSRFIVTSDNVEEEIDLTSEIKSEGLEENPDLLECRLGRSRAMIMRVDSKEGESTYNYEIFAKIGEKTYFSSVKSLNEVLDLSQLNDKIEVQKDDCNDSDHNHDDSYQNNVFKSSDGGVEVAQNLDDCLARAQNQEEIIACLERFENELLREFNHNADGLNLPSDRYGPIEDMGTPRHYVMYLDIIADQYFMRDRTDQDQPRNIRFRQAKDQIEKYMVLSNIFFNSELDLTIKIKRMYVYFGNNKFHKDTLGAGGILGNIFDDMEDFFENRPTNDRAFSFLATTISREDFLGFSLTGASSSSNKVCDPGYVWSTLSEVENDDDLSSNERSRNWHKNYSEVLFHEFSHQIDQRHNYDYGDRVDENRDCCQLAFELDIPVPEDRAVDYDLNPRAEERLRSCMVRNYHSRGIDWLEIDSNQLLDNVFFGTIMSNEDFGGVSRCIGRRLTYSNPTRKSMSDEISSHYRIGTRIDGDGDVCVSDRENLPPEIGSIEVVHHGEKNYTVQVNARDEDQESMQFRGPNGEVVHDITLVYQLANQDLSRIHMTQESSIDVDADDYLEKMNLRVYDDRGDFSLSDVILIPNNIVQVDALSHEIPFDSVFDFSVLLNRSVFDVAGDGSLIFPEWANSIELDVDFYGDGREVERFQFDDFEDLLLNHPTLRKRYLNPGNYNIKVNFRLGGFQRVILYPIEVLPNQAPIVDDLEFKNDRSILDTEALSPNMPIDFSLYYSELNTFQSVDVRVDFGDGSSSRVISLGGEELNRVFEARHTYREPGSYRVTFSLNDQNGGVTNFSRNIDVQVFLQESGNELMDFIHLGEEVENILRVESFGYNGNLLFEFNHGGGRLEQRVVTSQEAREGVLFSGVYDGVMAEDWIWISWRVKAVGPDDLTFNIINRSHNMSVFNARPVIDVAKYYSPYTMLEIIRQMPQEDLERWRISHPEEYAEALSAEVDDEQRIIFKVRFHDLNGHRERFTYHWSFSNGGVVENQLILDRGEIQGEHVFQNIDENEWGFLRVCDSQGACVSRFIHLNEANRMDILEGVNQNLGIDDGIDLNMPDADSPFGI